MKKFTTILAASVLLMGLSGCSYLFYPQADEFRQKAKGTTSVDTLLNLADMMDKSADEAMGKKGKGLALDNLHNQFHAFDNTLCCVDEAKQLTPTYDLAVTHNKELWSVFKRVWEFKDDQPQRDEHLTLFKTELQEMRSTLEALK